MKYWKIISIATLLFVCVLTTSVDALVISPARYEVTLSPGTQAKTEITLINDQKETRTFYISYENFEAQGDSGAPKFIGAKDGLATWISAPDSIVLKPGESRKMEMTISPPATVEPGGYFGAIFWSTTPPNNSNNGQVTIGAKIGMLIFLSINGDVKEDAGLVNFHVKDTQWFHRALPIGFTYQFSNDGGDRVNPKGTIAIHSILGWKVSTVNANPSEGNVLPHTTRKFTPEWAKATSVSQQEENKDKQYSFFGAIKHEWKNFAVGFFQAKLSVQFGTEDKRVQSNSIYFVVFPTELILVVLIIGGLFYVGGRKMLGNYKKRIIEKARAGMV